MRLFKTILSICILAFFSSCEENLNPPVQGNLQSYDLVNPFIGTGGHGHTFPGAIMPFGMVQLSPDTRLDGWDGCSAYHYSDSVIYGFSHTHLSGTGVSDYGDILISPSSGIPDLTEEDLSNYKTKSFFKKSSENAKPGLYSVYLDDAKVDVKLTVTPRVAIHNYTFNGGEKENSILINLKHRDKVLGSKITLEDDRTISGYRFSEAWASNQKVFFVLKSSVPFKLGELDADSSLYSQIYFNAGQISLKLALSFTSIEGAKRNLETEADHWEFEEYIRIARKSWQTALDKIKIKSQDQEKSKIFYSALYHSMIAPNLSSDVDGSYRGMDDEVHKNVQNPTYTVFSLWDTFRASHPLFTIIEQDRTKSFIQTFLNQYQQGEKLPVWELASNETNCMIGYHSVSVITDAYKKGLTGFNTKLALEAMINSAESDDFGLEFYHKKGYIGAGDEPESVSKTLEYAYDDWCIAEFAKEIGEQEMADKFYKRALNYKNLFDPESKFFRARMKGNWFSPFDPSEVNFNYTEANAWQYSLFIPQDIQGFTKLMGGDGELDNRLDNLFTAESETTGRDQADITGLIGQYAHGNEPSHHMAYLYNYIQKPWKTQKRVNQILNEQYQNAPDGLSGNEDCGQMSAWFVMSAMGIYSVTPGQDFYALSSPLFEEANIHLENGNIFTIKSENFNSRNIYIQSATLNGKPLTTSFLKHQRIMMGGELVFEMGPEPNETWGVGEGNYPVSIIEKQNFVAAPYIKSTGITFTDSLKIEMLNLDPEAQIVYSYNGGKQTIYKEPLTIKENANFSFFATNAEALESSTVKADFKKIKKGRSIELFSEYANQYAAEGNNSLIDQLKGNTNYRTGFWQGYQGQDMVAIIDLGKEERVNTISTGFLQDIKSWIFYPQYVEYSISTDGKNYQTIAKVMNSFADNEEGAFTQELSHKGNYDCRFVKVVAKYYGDCPEWHLGAGGKSWIFADEISID